MADITFTFTTSNLNEVKAALLHHKGGNVGNQSTADVKAWMTGHVNGLVGNYREKLRNDANVVSTTSVVS
jgi:hypothetical protein